MVPLALGLGLADGLARAAFQTDKSGPGAATQAKAGVDFANVLSEVAASASQSIAAAEKTGVAAFHGQASTREVVEKLMYAEQNLQVALSLRDKTVAALQEISRMAI
ncbi:MAG: flagellar hook-basal body complex protein FliE [Rhodoblastus sp.]